MRNTGKPAEDAFNGWVENHGKAAWMYEFPDTKKVKGMMGKHGVTLAQPADRLLCLKGHMFLAEVKSTTDPKRFKKSHIRSYQWSSAVRTTAAGGDYFFFIRRETDKQWYRVPAQYLISNERPSWTWEELTPFEWSLSL